MNNQQPITELDRYIRARYPLIAIQSHEETRLIEIIRAIGEAHKKQVAIWTCTIGLKYTDTEVESDSRDILQALFNIEEYPPDDPTIFVFLDAHPFTKDSHVARKLRDIAQVFETCRHTCVFLSPAWITPPDLEKSVVVMDWPLPDEEILGEIVGNAVLNLDPSVPVHLNGDTESVIRAMSGLTEFEARSVLASAIIATGELSVKAIPYIVNEKKQIIRKSGALEYYEPDPNLQVGGLEKLQEYTRRKLKGFSREAREFGLDIPKGVLLVGIPGTGKSLSVKAIAGNSLPLLKMDMGAMMGSLVGQSEGNIRAALAVADAVAPCVLWIDELDKALGGIGGDQDGGTSLRVLGTVLTWMQEHKSPVYVAATANDIRNLQPELIRRFDDLFWTDLPCLDDRKKVLCVHLRKRHQNPLDFDLDGIAGYTWGMTGAEIEKVVQSGMELAFDGGEKVQDWHFIHAAETIVPIARTMQEKIKTLRSWAKDRAIFAAAPLEEAPDGKKAPGADRFKGLNK